MRNLFVKVFICILVSIVCPVYAADITINPSTFDTSLDSYTTLSDNQDYIYAAHINYPNSAIIAIEGILGLGIKGTQSTLSARLNQMLSGSGAIKSGTSFPTSPTPVNAQLFYRNDLKSVYIYDGATAQWLQIQWPASFSFSSPSSYVLTLYHNITAGRTITFPDATTTLVGYDTTQTLTNKTIDDASNTLTVLETSVTDGTLLARVGASETITGLWTFGNILTSNYNAPQIDFKETGVTADNGWWQFYVNGETLQSVILNDAGTVSTQWLRVDRTGTTIDSVAFPNGVITVAGQLQSTLSTGTAPFSVASTTVNTNLNADTVDGADAGNAANNVLLLDGSGLVPLADIPATLTGKDADTLDTYHASSFSLIGHTHTQKQIFTSESNAGITFTYGEVDYLPINGSLGDDFTESKIAVRMPSAGAFNQIAAYISYNALSGGTFKIKVYKNGVANETFYLEVATGVTGWQTVTGSLSYAAGDIISYRVSNDGTGVGSVDLHTIVSQHYVTIN